MIELLEATITDLRSCKAVIRALREMGKLPPFLCIRKPDIYLKIKDEISPQHTVFIPISVDGVDVYLGLRKAKDRGKLRQVPNE